MQALVEAMTISHENLAADWQSLQHPNLDTKSKYYTPEGAVE